MLPLWQLVENPTEGTQVPHCTNQSVSRVDICPNWAPHMLLPENLDLKVRDTHQPLWDIRSKACEFGNGDIAVMVNSVLRPKESQSLERTMKQEAEQHNWEAKGSCLSAWSLAGPNLALQSPSNPRFHQHYFMWVLVTCYQKKLETTLLTNLEHSAGQQDSFSMNSKSNDTAMTTRASEYSDSEGTQKCWKSSWSYL